MSSREWAARSSAYQKHPTAQTGLGGIADALRNWAEANGVPVARALATLAEEMVPGVPVLAPVPAEGNEHDV